MKTIITVICIGLLLGGCATGNYTWTPTAEEWANMTPTERSIWSANEMQVRQNAANSWQNFWNNYSQYQLELFKAQRPTPLINPYTQLRGNNYWQEQRARQEYQQNWP